MAPRLYSRLPEGRFRLIKLLPGRWDDPLEAELFEADRTFEYTALSYTWGSRRALGEVTLNGVQRGITVNLDLALRTLRSARDAVTLWADALCIDQEDVLDKSAQVGLMNDIFGWAAQVRAYVGDPLDRGQASFETRREELGPLETFEFSDDEDEAWEEVHSALSELETGRLAEMSAHQRCRCIFGLLRALSSPRLTTKLQEMDLFSSKLSTKMELKQRNLFEWLRIFVVAPWWDRMWITQEVGVARELVLSYGKVKMAFSMLAAVATAQLPISVPAENARVAGLLSTKLRTISELRRLQRYESVAEMRDLDYFQRSLGSPLLWLLRTSRHRHSSEPRDKIYALSRLLTKLDLGSRYKLKTDYGTSVAALFCRVAVLMMQETSLFWITSADLVAKSRDNLPSWVPNWTDGFTTPDTENAAWKMRLCHNVSNISFSVEAPLPPIASMEPSKYFCSLAADAESSTWTRHRGGECKYNEPFAPSIEAGRADAILYSRHFFLDRENTEPRRIQYEYHEPEIRDLTKVENCLKLPSQFCSTVRHVSEPIAPDLSNLAEIVDGLHAAHYRIFPHDWEDMVRDRVQHVGRVLCFGAVLKESGDARRLERYDNPNLALLVHLLTRPGEVQTSGAWHKWYRQKTLLELRSPCTVCQTATYPCSECEEQSEAKPIPSSDEAWKDPYIIQLHKTALQTAPGNSILMTRGGTFALGPSQSQVGDRISILSGGLCPYVLRRDTNPKHLGYLSFQLVGDCFLNKTPAWDTEKLETVALV